MRAEQIYLRQQRLATPSEGAAVATVFVELVQVLAAARRAIAEQHLDAAHDGLIVAQQVLASLRTGLAPEPSDLVQNLQHLYAHCEALLARANVEKSVGDIDQALQVLSVLRDAWQDAAATTTSGR